MITDGGEDPLTAKTIWVVLKRIWKPTFGILLPVILLPLPLMAATQEAKCGYVLLLMAGYFTFEPIPLAVTALIPVFLFPMMGILGTEQTCYQYMKDTIMMYLGGLLFAAAVEHSNLHKRIALKVLLSIGTSPQWIMLGFMLTTMFLSMWITNTATTAMMVPIVDAVIKELEKEFYERQHVIRKMSSRGVYDSRKSVVSLTSLSSIPEEKHGISGLTSMVVANSSEFLTPEEQDVEKEDLRKMLSSLHKTLLLSLAFAANFGGTGTLIGSGPNLVLKAQMDDMFPDYKDLTFSTWMMYNIPGMLISTFVLWIVFQAMYVPCCKKYSESDKTNKEIVKNVIQKNYDELGYMSYFAVMMHNHLLTVHKVTPETLSLGLRRLWALGTAFHEMSVMMLFIFLVILWLMREPQFTTGWSDTFVYGSGIKDATPAIGVALFLFLIPARPKEIGRSPPLLDWKTAQRKIPWGVLILLGGGIALAEGAKKSGLSRWISGELEVLQSLPPDVIAVILCLLTAALTEFISNMSMATIMLPVVCQMAIVSKVHPFLFMLPVTIACSFAFMLPVGNPSNAIVFDSCDMKTSEMVKPGIIIKLIACAIELVMINTLGVSVFDLHTFPPWANKSLTVPLSLETLSHSEMNSTLFSLEAR